MTSPKPWLFISESKIFNWESKVTRRRSTSPCQKLPNPKSGKGPHTLHIKTLKFIYVDNKERNRLMRSDELYKFSNKTLTGLQTSMDDITKNIQMEYLPQRRWITLEKKRATIMIKAIDKQMKEKRMTRSLEKFVGVRWLISGIHSHDPPRTGGFYPGDIPLDSVEVLRKRVTYRFTLTVLSALRRSAFKSKKQQQYEKLVQKSQDHKKAKDHKMMIRDYAWLMISKKLKIHIQVKPIRTSSSLKSMITTTYHKLKIEVKDYELKTKVES
ncbi:hypothetical protein Tco_1556549 [Tanacetum coccineum]